MVEVNHSTVSEFVLLGLCDSLEHQIFFFVLILVLYLVIAVGNIFIVILVITDSHLHSPMYFLLANLSLVDLWLSSVTSPKMITDLHKENKTVSFGGCMCQNLFGHFLGGIETVLLVGMAYNYYVAICKPLHYTVIMSQSRYIWLVMISWTIGFVHSMSQLAVIVELPFCGPRIVNSFFCDIPLVIELACIDSYSLGILMNSDSGILAMTCFILLLISYIYILFTVTHYSKDGATKALSTCTAPVTVLVLFFGPCIFIYVWPVNITLVDKFLAVFYSVITPLLNPAMYTCRNKEMKVSLRRFKSQYGSSRWNL
ncbi:olfactory receptor 4F4-like [Trichosurus vulpecula]|uniref:olfactory receptor 4F4-like n=1 Tax=Trichosurus vulpecula TaxID=9337 RepID=UPI00186AE353|nr:olfactory receptor 4F4-like [Trichosurus vulpecula]